MQRFALVWLHLLVVLLATTGVLGHLISLPASGVVVWRTFLASVGAAAWTACTGGGHPPPDRRTILRLLGIGAIVGIHWLCFFLAIKLANISICLAGMATTSFFTAFTEPLLERRPVRRVEVGLGCMALAGLLLVAGFEPGRILGIAVALASALLAAIFPVLNRRMVRERGLDPMTMVAWEMAGACGVCLLAVPWDAEAGGYAGLARWQGLDWAYILLLAGGCTVFAFAFHVALLRHVTAYASNLAINMEPVYGILAAALLFGEHTQLHPGFYLGAATIVAANLLHPLLARRTTVAAVLLAAMVAPPAAAQPAPGGADDPAVVHGRRVAALLADLGWADLWNGRDLAGWTGDTQGYAVEDGVLVCRKGGKDLATVVEYGDFALEFQFRLEASGNNGIGIRVPAGGHPSSDGLEIQILDHDGDRYRQQAVLQDGTMQLTWLKPWQAHGSVYGIAPARTGYSKPVGEWNTETIVAVDDHVLVLLNGAVIVDAFLDDMTPLDGHPHPGRHRRRGQIVLSGHDDRVEFRGLKIADLSAPAQAPRPDAANQPPAGYRQLFDGTSLGGWKGLAHEDANARRTLAGDALQAAQAKADGVMREHWSVVDGELVYDGAGQSLCTAGDYGDFDLLVDWKIPPGADSGIYLRGTPQIQIWDPWDARVPEGEKPPTTPQEWVARYGNGRNLGSGGLWNNARWRNQPLALADRPAGEWNTFQIRMVGDKVTVRLNDVLVVDRVKLENYWDKDRTAPLPRADQIELQHHGSRLWFRNLFVRELPY